MEGKVSVKIKMQFDPDIAKETTTKITKKTTTKFFSNEKSESVDSVKSKKANSVNDRLDENKELSEKEEITPPKNSAKSPPTALALAYKFCTEFKLPIMNNTVFKSKMKALSKLMDDDSEKIDMYFATLAKLQDQECIDDPFCPKVYNALDIYSKYNNVRTYYASKMKEAAAKMSTVEELMNKQAGRQWEI
jgi:PAB1-binding protein PBP1